MTYRQEEIKPYDGNGDKGKLVGEMFDNIAPTYDKLNHRLSWNVDKGWRKKAIKYLKPFRPQKILDVATGTGDLGILAAQMLRPSSIVGVDISEGMMEVAKEKVKAKGLDNIVSFQKEDCMQMSFEDNTFDAVLTAFGIRNFQDLEQGLREIYRVLCDGGQMCVLELTTPVSFPMKQLFHIYSHSILPFYGKLVSKDPSAYTYLTQTIDAFPQGETMMDVLRKIGFSEMGFRRLTFGICTMYFATK